MVTESELRIAATESGLYTCMGCSRDECELGQAAVFITSLPGGFQVSGPGQAVEGDAVELLCAASKYNFTTASLAWYKQEAGGRYRPMPRPAATQPRLTPARPSKFEVGQQLKFDSVKPEDSGVYACRTGRKPGQAGQEGKLELTVRRLEVPEFVETLNMNMGTKYIQEEGETLEMKCKVLGYPLPTVTWFLNSTAVDPDRDDSLQLYDEGQSLVVRAVVGRHEGTWTCVARNRAGVSSLDQKVVLVEPPRIERTDLAGSQQIIDTESAVQLVEPGTTLNFTCEASGVPVPTITWLRDKQVVRPGPRAEIGPGRTRLTVRAALLEDAGRYECVASNLGGRVSRYRLVRVLPATTAASLLLSWPAIPVYIAAGAALLLGLAGLLVVRCCCRRSWKAPPSPAAPRLTQYEQPEDLGPTPSYETESCSLTGRSVTSGSRPASPHCHACLHPEPGPVPYTGLYGCSGLPSQQILGSSLVAGRGCYSPPLPHPVPSPMSDFTHYTSQATLPLRMETLSREATRRFLERQSNISPPLTAEF